MWSEYPTFISSLLKVISLAFYKRALSSVTSVVKHSISALKAMLTKAFVAILCSFTVSPNLSNKLLNLELLYRVVTAAVRRVGLSFSPSPRSVQMTTTATLFPLWFGSGFL